jgi:hypothetical protein
MGNDVLFSNKRVPKFCNFHLQVHLLTWWRPFPSIFFPLHNYPRFEAIKYIPRMHKIWAPDSHGNRILNACTYCLSALVRKISHVTILAPVILRLIPDIWSGPGCNSRYSDSLRTGRSGDRIAVGGIFSKLHQPDPGVHPATYIKGP